MSMNPLVRFWLVVLSVVSGLAACGYLFLGFLFPTQEALATASEFRLVVALVGAGAAGMFIWAMYSTESTE